MATLFVVATPIGNLADLSARVQATLRDVDVIAVEDSRHTGQLLAHLNISTRMLAMHAHNEAESTRGLLQLLAAGQDIAVVSDAGTPLISDPGFELVKACHERGIRVVPIAGPSALTAALSVAGLPTDRFTFMGFLPAKAGAKTATLKTAARFLHTQVYFEAPHRIVDTIAAIVSTLGANRQLTVCRELTKTFEQIVSGTAAELAAQLADGSIPQKGEFVLVVSGPEAADQLDADDLLTALLTELPPSKAAGVAAKLVAASRSELYDRALVLRNDRAHDDGPGSENS